MKVFQWDQSFETGQTEVDRQHRRLVDLTNDFGQLLTDNAVDSADVDRLFAELVDYTQYHFDEEEKVMLNAGIDKRHFDLHQQEHQNFFQDVTLLRKETLSDSDLSAKDLFEFLINWLVYHILGSDKNMARQINNISHGDSAAEAFAAEEQQHDSSTAPLLKSLNNLFQQVASRNRQLAELNRDLEDRVEQRTRELQEANQKLQQLATTDMLTGLANRRFAMQALEQLWTETARHHTPLGCMLIDADHFKQINDNYGHDAGDTVLCELGKQLQYVMRTDDIVCRIGGDEFLIICPNTDSKGLLHIAEQMHEQVARMQVQVTGGFWNGSISVGIAVKSSAMKNTADLIKAADNGVYAAKAAGKNCIKQGELPNNPLR